MSRATNGPATKKRRKKVLKSTKGFFGNKSRLYRYAKDALQRARKFAYQHRKKKKSEFRKLWIIRLNAICRNNGMNYSKFIHLMSKLNYKINRKILSELAIHNPKIFETLLISIKQQSTNI